jgi:Tol biopolymer transport system component/DNA-binding winged helix-turn-helix (wHTH) protein
MAETAGQVRFLRFGNFEVDLRAGELRKAGVKLKFGGQPFQVLTVLLEHAGEVVTREELQKQLWPDTFVDVDHNLNTAINKIREVLGDSAESPRFVETLPRRGYRFITAVETEFWRAQAAVPTSESPKVDLGVAAPGLPIPGQRSDRGLRLLPFLLICAVVLLVAGAALFYRRSRSLPMPPAPRALQQLTFDEGLQYGATWSPDARFIAYAGDRGGKFDIWVQQVGGGDPVQITKRPGHNWQPDWSPNGEYIAYRSEGDGGGLFVVPALGGVERRITSFGYNPRWSPDGSRLLFQTDQFTRNIAKGANRVYVVDADGGSLHEVPGLSQPQAQGLSVAWHPDGKRVTVLWQDGSFWTVPIDGGVGVRSELNPVLVKRFREITRDDATIDWAMDFKFSWAPSGTAIYLEATSGGARTLCRIAIEPKTLRMIGIEPLTTGTGFGTELAISPDGKQLAFTEEVQHVRAWLFPFNATEGRVTGPGQAATSSAIDAWAPTLSRDGNKLLISGSRGGKEGIWEVSLPDSRETLLVMDADSRGFPQWSRDGERFAYAKGAPSGEGQFSIWSRRTGTEEPLTRYTKEQWGEVYDWSPDGESVLVTRRNKLSKLELWSLPLAAAPDAAPAAHKVISDPDFDVFQGHYSPDGEWIAFIATALQAEGETSTIFVTRTTGGPWVRMTDSKHWDDKPRWSPDGKTLYYLSAREGFLNVWGIRVNSKTGGPSGSPFRVTAFNSPSLMVPNYIPPVEISISQNRLVVTAAQVSGHIWKMEDVNR